MVVCFWFKRRRTRNRSTQPCHRKVFALVLVNLAENFLGFSIQILVMGKRHEFVLIPYPLSSRKVSSGGENGS